MTSDVQILQNILRSIKQYYDPQKNLVSVRPGDPIFNEPAGGESSPESSPLPSISQAPEEELGFLDKALMRLYGQDENKYREGLALAKLKGERQKEELRGLEGKDVLGGYDPTGYDPTTVSGPPGVEEQLLEQLNKGVELATAFGGGVGTQVKFGSGAKPTTQLGGSASTHAIQEMMRGAAPAGRPRPSDRPTEVLGGHKLDPEGRPIREAVKIQEGADYGYDPVGDGINVKMVPSGRVLKLEEAKQELKKIREAPAEGRAPISRGTLANEVMDRVESLTGIALDHSSQAKNLQLMYKLLPENPTRNDIEITARKIIDQAGWKPIKELRKSTESPEQDAGRTAPRPGLGFKAEGEQRGFAAEKYPVSQAVKVTFPDGTVHYDVINGLNQKHALERARYNWEGAKVEPTDIGNVTTAPRSMVQDELRKSTSSPRGGDEALKTDALKKELSPESDAKELGPTIKKASDFRESGNYDVSVGGKKHQIFRDPENGFWYLDPGSDLIADQHFSRRLLGFNKKEAFDRVVKLATRGDALKKELSPGVLNPTSKIPPIRQIEMVVEGSKPAAIFEGTDSQFSTLRPKLEALGIPFEKVNGEWFVARDKQTLQSLISSKDAATRGRILGYSEADIKAYENWQKLSDAEKARQLFPEDYANSRKLELGLEEGPKPKPIIGAAPGLSTDLKPRTAPRSMVQDELRKSSSEPLTETETFSRVSTLPVSGKRSLSLLKEYGEQLKSKVKNLTGVDVSDVDITPSINMINGINSSFNPKEKRIEMAVMRNAGARVDKLRKPGDIFDTLLHEFAHAGSMRGGAEALHLLGGTYNFPLGKGVKAVTPFETGEHTPQNLIERAKFSNPDFQFLTRMEALKNDPSIQAMREKFIKDWYSTQND